MGFAATESLNCEVCGVKLAGLNAKARKQHEKSMPHKSALRGEVPKAAAKRKSTPSCTLHRPDAENAVQVVHIWDGLDTLERPLMDVQVCLAPDVVRNPRKALKEGRPFITFKSVPNGTDDWDPSALTVDELVERCCRAGGRRVPNIDLDGLNVTVSSFRHASEILIDAISRGTSFWTSLQADDEVVHPDWWPQGRLVPGYTNVLVTQGFGSGIGLHVDVDNFSKKGPVIDTYLTLIHGCKQVLLLPPQYRPEKMVILGKLPARLTPEELAHVRSNQGFFFQLDARAHMQPVTLFIPRGWHHWLVSTTATTTAFTASTF